MTEETRPGFLTNYKIVRPARPAQVKPGPVRPAFGPARLTPLLNTEIYKVFSTSTFVQQKVFKVKYLWIVKKYLVMATLLFLLAMYLELY